MSDDKLHFMDAVLLQPSPEAEPFITRGVTAVMHPFSNPIAKDSE
jgi:hypothetical protein